MTNRSNSSYGFSLVELLSAIAIIGFLSSMTMTAFRNFKYRANRAEAYVNLPVMRSLLTAMEAPTCMDVIMNAGACSSGVGPGLVNFFTALGAGNLVYGDNSSISSCVVPNKVGFAVRDCRKLNYLYSALIASGPGTFNPETTPIFAIEGGMVIPLLNGDPDASQYRRSFKGCDVEIPDTVGFLADGSMSADPLGFVSDYLGSGDLIDYCDQ